MTHRCAVPHWCARSAHRTPSSCDTQGKPSSALSFTRGATDRAVSGRTSQTPHLSKLSTDSDVSASTPVGHIQFEEADPHTPVNSHAARGTRRRPVSSKVQRSGLVHIIGKDPPKIPNLSATSQPSSRTTTLKSAVPEARQTPGQSEMGHRGGGGGTLQAYATRSGTGAIGIIIG